jgi:RHS repeat-associated protein
VENGITWKQDYNAENRLAAVHKINGDCASGALLESWLFAYDGDGIRVSTAHFVGGTAESLSLYYFGGSYEVTDGAVRKYYSFAGQTIAMKDANGLQYFLTDHLGSIVAVTDSSGTLISEQRYLPFGQTRTDLGPIAQTDYGYTGQRALPDTGLMDYRARFYDPSLGRFAQPDTLIPEQSQGTQAWDRYAYVNNNPLRYSDPSGHFAWLPLIVAAGALLGAAIDYGTQVYNNYQSNGGNVGAALTTNIDLASIGKSALIGAAVGATVAIAAPAVVAAAGDALAGTGLLTGSTALFSAGMTAYGAATTLENALLGTSTAVAASETTALNTPNEIGAWGEQQVSESLPVEVRPFPVSGGQRIYDGRFMGTENAYVEIKTSTRGVITLSPRLRAQIAFDAEMEPKPTWLLVNARPSTGLMSFLREARIPWHQLHIPQ